MSTWHHERHRPSLDTSGPLVTLVGRIHTGLNAGVCSNSLTLLHWDHSIRSSTPQKSRIVDLCMVLFAMFSYLSCAYYLYSEDKIWFDGHSYSCRLCVSVSSAPHVLKVTFHIILHLVGGIISGMTSQRKDWSWSYLIEQRDEPYQPLYQWWANPNWRTAMFM